MRLLLPLSLATAVVTVGTVVYLYVPLPRTARPDRPPVPLVMADPSPVRVIPLGGGSSPAAPVPRPAVVSGPGTVDGAAGASVAGSPGPIEALGPGAQAKAVGPEPVPAAGGDVLASVGRTLDDIRAAEAGPAGASAGSGLADEQVEALRQLAARRKVRPVTRMSFPLEPGAEVPAQVYLHPVPPEMAGLAPGEPELGFAVVNDRFVVVGRQSRRVVALSTAR